MKTTHQIAAELLALPNVPLVIEGWITDWPGHEMTASMTTYDPEGTAIIWQKPVDPVDISAYWICPDCQCKYSTMSNCRNVGRTICIPCYERLMRQLAQSTRV